MDKIYWYLVNIWYKLFYRDKIVTLILSEPFEKGDMLMPQHYVVIKDSIIEDTGITHSIVYRVTVISNQYQVTKQEFWETVILSTLILLFLGFLIYIF